MSWLEQKKPIIALAPMADYTDAPFCRVCREVTQSVILNEVACLLAGRKDPSREKGFFANAQNDNKQPFVIFREMVSSEAIVRGNEKTLEMCEFDEIERPVVLQLFGSKPEVIAEAAKIVVEKYHPDGIDINMGCPVPKIAQKSLSGASLMKDHERAVEIIKSLKKANLGLPISVKTRLGWKEDGEILEFAQKLENAGVDAISIHGRTKVQGYAGKANWGKIAEVKKKVSIPIIANGDINSHQDIQQCLEITKADGVMIGRGALGNPWIFSFFPPPIRGRLGGGLAIDETPPSPSPYRGGEIEEIKNVVLRHAKLHLAHYGDGSMTTFRKHLLCYFRGIPGIKEIKKELVKVSTLGDLSKILEEV